MALIVQKYGGTSVGSVERIQAVADRIIASREKGNQIVVVVSAMSGETNKLIALASEIDNQPPAHEMDVLVSTGEQVTIALLSMALNKKGAPARRLKCSLTVLTAKPALWTFSAAICSRIWMTVM